MASLDDDAKVGSVAADKSGDVVDADVLIADDEATVAVGLLEN